MDFSRAVEQFNAANAAQEAAEQRRKQKLAEASANNTRAFVDYMTAKRVGSTMIYLVTRTPQYRERGIIRPRQERIADAISYKSFARGWLIESELDNGGYMYGRAVTTDYRVLYTSDLQKSQPEGAKLELPFLAVDSRDNYDLTDRAPFGTPTEAEFLIEVASRLTRG